MSQLNGNREENVRNSGNPWNRTCFNEETKNKKHNNMCQSTKSRFQIAKEEMHASVQKHLQGMYESSSDEEELESELILKSVLKNYSELNNEPLKGAEKIQEFLQNSFQSGAVTCLICLSTIKRIDPIWNCLECYGCFHLVCIQKWSRDSVFQQNQAQQDFPEFKRTDKINWPCPKCRHEYDQSYIPKKYYCFCGAEEDPACQPFLVPHSCGETCNKILMPECGHSCLLLCHPGPCPPCPKTVEVLCHCRKYGPKIRRCNNKSWSCNTKCGKLLFCGKHVCEEICHSGDCPKCDEVSIQECNCGLQKRKQPCMTPTWQCLKICGKPFSCMFHRCEVVCHRGSCGECPRSLIRTCPCGKSENKLPCTEEVPTCNETCGKLLECGVHYCSQKCHRGRCGMCLEVVMKVCRCGQSKKELPCEKEFLCKSKCTLRRNCSRHPCSRKCCDMNCPPCEKQCNRTLSCGNHKCPSACHKGLCYPCPEVVQIKCRCGSSVISVPCGREKRTKPPKCNKLCLFPPKCHHPSSEQHYCHYGECPPCNLICGKERKNCQHKCVAPCHSYVWQKINENPSPAGPWEAAQVQLKRCNLPCPDCEFPVPVLCFGGHETVELPCFKAESFPCTRPCGRLLKCGNHKCEKQCHPLDSNNAGENCSECKKQCSKERPKGCMHKCLNPCHPGDCPPCRMNLKIKCHCSVSVLHFVCGDYFPSSDQKKDSLLVCGNRCPKSYPCGHPCRMNCHSGECPEPELCKKKVKLSCKCGKLRKLVPCDLIRKNDIKFVDCADSCTENIKEGTKLRQEELERAVSKDGGGSCEDFGRSEKKVNEMKDDERIESARSNAKKFLSFNHGYIFVSVMVTFIAAAIFYFNQ